MSAEQSSSPEPDAGAPLDPETRRGLLEGTKASFRKAARGLSLAGIKTALRKRSRSDRLRVLLDIVALAGILAAVLVFLPEWRWEAARFAARAGSGAAFHDDLVLVGLDEAYAAEHGGEAEIDSQYLARLVRALADLDANVVAIDALVSPGTDTASVSTLVEAVAYARGEGTVVVLPVRTGGFGSDRATGERLRIVARPPPGLDALVRTGYTDNVLVEETIAEGVIGTPVALDLPVAVRLEESGLVPSFPTAAVRAHHSIPPLTEEDSIRFTDGTWSVRAPDFGERYVALDYVADPTQASYRAAEDLLADDSLMAPLDGKLVLVAGVYEAGGADAARTPFGVVRGGLVHLYAMDTLLRGSWPKRWPPLAAFLSALALGLGCALSWRRSRRVGAAIFVLGIVGVLVIGVVSAGYGHPSPMAWPFRAVLIGALLGYLGRSAMAPEPDGPVPQKLVISGSLWIR